MNIQRIIRQRRLFWLFVATILGLVTLSACMRRAATAPIVPIAPVAPVQATAAEPALLVTPTAIVIDGASEVPATSAPPPVVSVATLFAVQPSPASTNPTIPIATPTACLPHLTTDSDINMRTGPGTAYRIIGNVLPKANATVIAKNADGSWLEVVTPGDQQGWVASANVTAQCIDTLPVVQPPLPLTVPIPLPVATSIPLPSPTVATVSLAPAATPQPSITFWADTLVVASGQCTTLRWSVINVADVYFNDGTGDVGVARQSLRQVCPSTTTAYQLKVVADDASVTQQILTVNVDNVNGLSTPSINFWSTSPTISAGTCTTLNWQVDNAQAVYFNDGSGDQGVAGHDSRSVCPQTTTTYSLRVVSNNGQSTQQYVTVNVDSQAEPTLIPMQPPPPLVATLTVIPIRKVDPNRTVIPRPTAIP